MDASLTIRQADVLNGNTILVNLSDGRVLELALEQFLSANPQEVPPGEQDDEKEIE